MKDVESASPQAPEGIVSHEPAPSAKGLRVAVVVSRYHAEVTEPLLRGAVAALVELGAKRKRIEAFWVPGAFELPLVVDRAARSGRFDAVVALGCVIKGETIHDRVIVREVTRGIGETMRQTGVPVGFGLLTVNSLEQARERAGGRLGNKGHEAALAAVTVLGLLDDLDASMRAGKA